METHKAIAPLIGDLRNISLYDDGLAEQIALFYEYPEGNPPITLKQQFGEETVKFRIYTGFDKDNGLYLQSYSVYVPQVHEKTAHFVHNGINSADLEEKIKTIHWNNESGWMQLEDSGNAELKKVQDFFAEINRFMYLEDDNDYRAAEKAGKMADYLLFTYLENTASKERLLQSQPHLEEIFYRELHFPPSVHACVVRNSITNVSELEVLSRLAYFENFKNKEIMNLNNLEDLRDEMKKLGFDDALLVKMEEHMKNNDPFFRLYDQVAARKGQVDITLHFKQSGQSDYYYLNRLEAVHNQLKPLEEGQKYLVITKNQEGKNMVKKLENFAEAIDFFKQQKGNSELAVGKDAANKSMVANMEEGKINYVSREFKRDFYSPPLPQTFWLDHGRGFSKEQAANLVQGRSVYRDDLLSREGAPYRAWMQLDTDKERDRNNNLTFRQFTDAYGYDVKALLDDYKIKEMADPKKAEALETSLMNGNRPMVTVEKDGQETKMFIETAVRYGKLNFYREDGKPEKREQFLKETGLEMGNIFSKKLEQMKDKDISQGQGMGVN